AVSRLPPAHGGGGGPPPDRARPRAGGGRPLQRRPAEAAPELARRVGGAGARTFVSRPTRGRVHRLFPQAQAQRGGPFCAMAEGNRWAGGRRADGLGAERVFRFFLGGCIMAQMRTAAGLRRQTRGGSTPCWRSSTRLGSRAPTSTTGANSSRRVASIGWSTPVRPSSPPR